MASRKTWGLGERRCWEDFGRRKMLFNYLVKSVMSYGVYIWGLGERRELERIQLEYYRLVMRLDFCTPGYVTLKETDTRGMWVDWAIRAFKFEERILRQDTSRLTMRCLTEETVNGNTDLYSVERNFTTAFA